MRKEPVMSWIAVGGLVLLASATVLVAIAATRAERRQGPRRYFR